MIPGVHCKKKKAVNIVHKAQTIKVNKLVILF